MNIENIIKYLELINISNELLGEWIRIFHFTSPIYGLIITLFYSKILVNLYIFFLISVISMFIYFNGCILSKLEKYLCKNDINIVDIFIEIIYSNKENINKKRYIITLIMGFFYVLFVTCVYYYRFIK